MQHKYYCRSVGHVLSMSMKLWRFCRFYGFSMQIIPDTADAAPAYYSSSAGWLSGEAFQPPHSGLSSCRGALRPLNLPRLPADYALSDHLECPPPAVSATPGTRLCDQRAAYARAGLAGSALSVKVALFNLENDSQIRDSTGGLLARHGLKAKTTGPKRRWVVGIRGYM